MKAKHSEGPLETAVRLLAGRDHTEMQLREKLRRKTFTREEIDDTIACLIDRGYLNDAGLEQRLLEKFLAEGRYGLRGIVAKLKQIGLMQISEVTVRRHYSEDDEWETAQKLLKKHFPVQDDTSFPRQARFLANRGFSSLIIGKIERECRKHQ